MTIIQPNSTKFRISLVMVILLSLTIIAVIANIVFYNDIINLRYLLNKQTKALQQIETADADLKNALYKILDSSNLSKLTEHLSLVKESKPAYLRVDKPVAVQKSR